jgi:thioredoxin
LDAKSFSAKLKQSPTNQIIDVRTSGEFAQGFIQEARNFDISLESFPHQISKLDKNKAVFVYCLTGSRSAYAMNYMKSVGYKEVYNLSGGIIRWRAANLPETTDKPASKTTSAGMTMAQYQALFNTNKLVLIHFTAEWCAPCKKMKPFLDEISKEYKTKVMVVRIDADVNKALLKELKIESIPVLTIHKNKKKAWTHNGFISKEEVVKKINEL